MSHFPKFRFFFFFVCFFLLGSASVFAEDDNACSGKIAGETSNLSAAFIDHGSTNFDAHGGNEFPVKADLRIVGLSASGLAPGSRSAAACVARPSEVDSGHATLGTFGADEYLAKGWVWNDNLGFISMYCGGSAGQKTNLSNDVSTTIPCGNYDYGVKIGAAAENVIVLAQGKVRQLTGFAWNPVFGYIQFSGNWSDGGGHNGTYGVYIDEHGNVIQGHSYAWTEAGVYLDFLSINFELPDLSEIDVCTVSYDKRENFNGPLEQACTDKGGVIVSEDVNGSPVYSCACEKKKPVECVTGDPACPTTDGGGDPRPDRPTDDPLPTNNYCTNQSDKVCLYLDPDPTKVSKAIELSGSMPEADGEECYNVYFYLRDDNGQPVASAGLAAANVDLNFVWVDNVKKDQLSTPYANRGLENFNMEETPFASTSNGAVNYKPVTVAINSSNVTRFAPVGKEPYYKLNRCISSYAPTSGGNVSYTLDTNPHIPVSNEIYFGQSTDFERPAPNNLVLQRVVPSFNGANSTPVYANGVRNLSLNFAPAVDFRALYADERKDIIEGVREIPVKIVSGLFIDPTLAGRIQKQLVNLKLLEAGALTTEGYPCSDFNFDFSFDAATEGAARSSEDNSYDLTDNFTHGDYKQVTATPLVPADANAEGCNIVNGAGLLTKISYRVANSVISYYSNKLPRLPGGLFGNPSADVKGTISAQTATTASREVTVVRTVGEVILNIVESTVFKNVSDLVRAGGGRVAFSTSKARCTVTDLVAPSCSGHLKTFTIGQGSAAETGYYFHTADLHLNLPNELTWSGRHIVIVDGGNLYIDDDLYSGSANPTGSDQLSIAVLRGDGATGYAASGNVYINDKDVTNIQATLFAQGGVFSDVGDAGVALDSWGAPDKSTSSVYFDILRRDSSQLFWQGSVASLNTLGGTSHDPLLTKGHATTTDRYLAQIYDLNFLRIFRLGLDVRNGEVKDQYCGAYLSNEDIYNIGQGQQILGQRASGDYAYCASDGNTSGGYCVCDGINPFEEYSATTNPVGDLVMLPGEEYKRARGLPTSENAPTYIYYTPNDSVLFRTTRQ